MSARSLEPVVITGIGLITSVGKDRESVWRALRQGKSGVQRLYGLRGFGDEDLICAPADCPRAHGVLKAFQLTDIAADEALRDARLVWDEVDRDRCACSVNAHMGDGYGVEVVMAGAEEDPSRTPWWEQFFPSSGCDRLARRLGANGPRLCHSTACASSLVSVLAAVRAIQDNQADFAITGGGDAIDPIFAAGFRSMRVLARAEDPTQACRPFDKHRSGFVMGEGAAILVVERLSHALRRGARIYAEIVTGKILSEAHHVTGLNAESDTLTRLIEMTLDHAGLAPGDIGYINVHGTGTEQNDRVEMRAIRNAFGRSLADVCASATKSMLGHTINASGGIELAITALAMRDGFAPPTLNLTDPDPECTFDCVPLVGRRNRFQHAMKLSVAFGGHLVAVVLRRWNDAATGFSYPEEIVRRPERYYVPEERAA